MPRRSGVPKRDVLPDPQYNSKVISKLINAVMMGGKKAVAQSIVYDALNIIAEKTNQNAEEYFYTALENVKPLIETRTRRLGSTNYQIPIEVAPARRQTLALRWLITNARKRTERGMENRLASEIMDAFNSTGGAVKKKEEVHKMAESNKAFAHFRW